MSAVQASESLPERARGLRAVASGEIVDAAFLSAAIVLGLIGFKTTYGDYGFLAGGLLGLVFGVVIAQLSIRLRLPSLTALAAAVVAFFALGGGTVLRSTAIGGVVPTLSTFHSLADASIHGWRDLLTLLPPVGSAGPLLVIPYLLGMTAGVSGYLLARRTQSTLLPAVAPVGVLAASILFGTPTPASLTLQGAVFAAVVLAWAGARNGRHTIVTAGGSRHAWRPAIGVFMLVASGAAATIVGPHLPFAHTHARVILRNYVQPPFDPSAYSSPLASFRAYVNKKGLGKKTLLTVRGLPPGARVRFATMDSYDGLAWGVSNGAPGTAGAFQRVGLHIPETIAGKKATLHVTIGAYNDVWLPDVGATDSIRFSGSDASTLAADYRYNLATGTAVIPGRLQAGDSYTLDAIVPSTPSSTGLAGAAPAGKSQTLFNVPPTLGSTAKAWAGSSSPGAYAKLQSIAAHLRGGAYSDGSRNTSESKPGHGEKRLVDFLAGTQLVGDDEQYAATFALLANALGFPSRVVLGAIPEADGTVKGADVHSWAEVDLTGVGWVPFDVTPPKSHHPNPKPPQVLNVNHTPNRVPPAAPAPPPARQSIADTSNSSSKRTAKHAKHSVVGVLGLVVTVARVAGPPLGLILGLIALIVGTKAIRRGRRRRNGTPVERVSAGWRELVDLAVDLGADRPARETRRGAVRALARPDLAPLAAAADAANFGPALPEESAALHYWAQVDELRRGILRGLGRARRWKALLSLASLNGPRFRRTRARTPAARASTPVSESAS